MEIITLATIIVGFLGLFIMYLQLTNQVKVDARHDFKMLNDKVDKLYTDLKDDIKDLKDDIKDLKEDNKILSAKIDKINSDLSNRIDAANARIDRLTDAIYSQKAG